jgi:hypothetical protein
MVLTNNYCFLSDAHAPFHKNGVLSNNRLHSFDIPRAAYRITSVLPLLLGSTFIELLPSNGKGVHRSIKLSMMRRIA